MARKKPHEEHENLERWLVSYADFMTLIFATFVVLYALSQLDIAGYTKLEESIKRSFNPTGVTDGSEGLMEDNSEKIVGSFDNNSVILMEYLSQKYEQASYEEIKQQLDEMAKSDRDFKNIEAEIDDRGLVIKFNDAAMMFSSGSAQLNPKAIKYLNTVGQMIWDKFKIHLIRIEGHTDSLPMHSSVFPSNWELSSARSSAIVRHFIKKFDFNPVLFSAVGLSDTRPVADNNTEEGRIMNRRVEIIVLRNKHKKTEMGNSEAMNQDIMKIEYLKLQEKQHKELNAPRVSPLSNDNLPGGAIIDIIPKNDIIILDNTYRKETKRIEETRKAPRKMFGKGD